MIMIKNKLGSNQSENVISVVPIGHQVKQSHKKG